MPLWIFFGLAYIGIGLYQPYLAVLLHQSGYAGWEIGVVASASPTVALLAGPLLGRWFDAMPDTRRLIRWLGVGTLMASALPFFMVHQGLMPLWLSIAGVALFSGSIIPLGTATTLSVLPLPDRFGRLRLVGSLTFAVAAGVAGYLYRDVGWPYIFWGYGIALCLAAWTLPPRGKRPGQSPLLLNGRGRWMTPAIGWLLVAIFLTQLANAGANTVVSLYYGTQLDWARVGWPWAWTALVEVPLFFFLPALFRKTSPAWILGLAMAGYAVRLASYPFIHSLWGLLAVQTVQALAFAGFYGGQVALMDRLAPSDRRGTAQSVLASWGMGLANLSGAILGGLLYSMMGLHGMFWTLAAVAGGGAVVFAARFLRTADGTGMPSQMAASP